MQFIRSCFNPTIYKKNWQRFWFFPLIYAIFLGISVTFIMYMTVRHNGLVGAAKEGYIIDSANNMVTNALTALTGIVGAMATGSYLFTTRSTYMMHAFPVKRSQLFGTSIVSGITMMGAPLLFVTLISWGYLTAIGYEHAGYMWKVFFVSMGMHFFHFSLATLCVMLSGLMISVPCLYLILNLIVPAVLGTITLLTSYLLYGVTGHLPSWLDGVSDACCPILSMGDFYLNMTNGEPRIWDAKRIIFYLIAAIVILAVSYVAYHFRKLECAGSFLAISWTAPILRWIASVCGGYGIAAMIMSIARETGVSGDYLETGDLVVFVVLALAFGALIYILVGMLFARTTHILKKDTFKELGILAGVLVVIVFVIRLDPLGREEYVPDPKDVSGMIISGYSIDLDTSDKELITEITDIQSQCITERLPVSDDYANVGNFTIYYSTKNGSLERHYTFHGNASDYQDPNSVASRLLALENRPEVIKQRYIGPNYDEILPESFYVIYTTGEDAGTSRLIDLNQEQRKKLYDAILADIDEGHMSDLLSYPLYVESYDMSGLYDTMIGFNLHETEYSIDADEADAYAYSYPDPTYIDRQFSLDKQAENTINALIELGVYKSRDEIK